MKLEKIIINGVLHYRWYSNQKWTPYTAKELTSLIVSMDNQPTYKAVYNESESSIDLKCDD